MLERVISLTFLSILLTGTASAAELRFAISDFSGPFSGPVRTGVVRALEGKVKVVASSEAQVRVIGDVSSAPRKRWILKLTVRGANGTPGPERRYTLKKPEIAGAMAATIARDVVLLANALPASVLAGTAAPVAEKVEAAADRPPVKEESAAERAANSMSDIIAQGAEEQPAAASAIVAPSTSEPETVTKRATDPGHVPKGGPEDPYRPASVSLGFALEKRSLTLSGADPAQLPSYESAFYPVVGLRAEVMPGELLDGSPQARNVGLRLAYARALPSTTRIAATGGSADTASSRLAIGPFYRVLFGPRERPTIVRPGVAFGSRNFEIDGDGPLPKTSHSYVEASIDVERPLFWRIGATGGFSVNIGTSMGDLEKLGAEASAKGFDLNLGTKVKLPWQLDFSAGLVYSQFSLTYTGAALAGPTATEGSDSFFGWHFALGYNL
jgi:hypothetical protein